MKKLLNILYLAVFVTFLMSCGADEGDSLVTIHRDSDNFAPFLTIDERDQIINISDATPSYTFTVSDPSGANVVATYDVSVSWTSTAGTSDTVSIGTYSTFPQTITYTLDDLAAALGTTAATFEPGDSFLLWSEITGTNGVTNDFLDLVGDAQNSQGLAQALRQVVFIACPFDQAEALGTYTLVTDGFPAALPGEDVTNIEAIAGPDETSVTFVNLFRHPDMYDVTVSVDPATGVATVSQQEAFDTGELVGVAVGQDFGVASLRGSGFFFSCTGFATLSLETTVAAGSFGSATYELQRN